MSALAGLSNQACERSLDGDFAALAFFVGGFGSDGRLIARASGDGKAALYTTAPVASSTRALGRSTMNAPALDYPALGASGLKVSRLWLGTMMFGDRTDEAEAARIVAATREAGHNGIDTADIYAGGESERITGRLIRTERSHWVLATKLANPTGPGPNDRGNSRRHVIAAVEASLQRLGTDWIDLLYLHRDDDGTPMEETAGAVARLIADGKVRYFGLSNFRGWRIAKMAETCRAMGLPPPIASQSPYNAMSRGIEVEIIPACAHYGLGLVAYSPLARGVLSGKYRPGEPPPEGSRAARGDRRLLQAEWRPESVALAQRLAAHAEARGRSAVELALGWVWHNRLVHSLIGGPRTLAQWQPYLDAVHAPFDAEDEALISSLVPAGHASTPGFTDPIYPVTGRVAAG
jgi:aryl-alcohol dehydrogenase (NADP+)